MSADTEPRLKLKGHPDAPKPRRNPPSAFPVDFDGDLPPIANVGLRHPGGGLDSIDREDYYGAKDVVTGAPNSRDPRVSSFSVVVTFTISDDDPPMQPYKLNINLATLKEEWKGTRNHGLCDMGFDNVLVRKITIGNKSTDSTFNAALKFFDKNGESLFQPVTTFGSDDTMSKSGIPVWGDDGARLVMYNPEPPTSSQMAYANLNIEDLTKGVTHHSYDVPLPKNAVKGAMFEMPQKMEITHLPKEPCAKYFEWALCVANEVYPEGFTDHADHVVGGLPGYFCIHTNDYHKVYDAFTEKKKRVGTNDLGVIKVELEPTDKVHRRLPSGVHSFRVDFEVWVPARHGDDGESDDEE